MDNELFKTKLTEVAEWFIPTDQATADIIPRPYPVKPSIYQPRQEESIEEEVDDNEETEEIEEIIPEFPPKITKLKNSCTCPDCGRECPNGRSQDLTLHRIAGQQGWRKRCNVCRQWQNPYNNKYEVASMECIQLWNKYLRGQAKEERLQERAQAAKEYQQTDSAGEIFEIYEDDTQIIKKYR